ncbi:MAG: hypothetical protein IJ646_12330 [Clostridia bacterium]|nr:hypothetical protein [Clostridia bacterium]
MLKLMKYEFRKMRTVLLILLGGVALLQAAFMVGDKIEDYRVVGVSLTLLTLLAFVVYFYIMAAGFLSYSRELSDKTGYMAFMTPVGPMKLIGSKLLFTALTAIVVTALFAAAAVYDYRTIFSRLEIDPELYEQANLAFRMFTTTAAGTPMSLTQVLLRLLFMLGSVMIGLMLFMCTAYLSITLGSTLLQAKKGFLRGVVTIVLFLALNWLTNRVAGLVSGSGEFDDMAQVMRSLGAQAGIELAIAVAFTGLTAWLLDRKVSL